MSDLNDKGDFDALLEVVDALSRDSTDPVLRSIARRARKPAERVRYGLEIIG
jgi:hypothetical protein